VHGKLICAIHGAAPSGVLRTSKFVPDKFVMFLSGGEKRSFERAGRKPKLGFFVKQGGVTKKSVP